MRDICKSQILVSVFLKKKKKKSAKVVSIHCKNRFGAVSTVLHLKKNPLHFVLLGVTVKEQQLHCGGSRLGKSAQLRAAGEGRSAPTRLFTSSGVCRAAGAVLTQFLPPGLVCVS